MRIFSKHPLFLIVLLSVLSIFTILGIRSLSDGVAGTTEYTLETSDGSERTYFVRLPKTYSEDTGEKYPLVVFFHGGGVHPFRFLEQTDLNSEADTRGFIAAYPIGTSKSDRMEPRCWNTDPKHCASTANDLEFVEYMLDELSTRFRIDRNHRYAVGFSVGGLFVHTKLRCVHGELFAGLASVEGGVWDVSCPRATTTPLFLIAQDATYVPADELASIAEDYQCTKAPEKLQYHYGNTRITKTHYDNCGESHEILFYNLATTTHSWPRFPTIAEGEPVSATNIALDFLLK